MRLSAFAVLAGLFCVAGIIVTMAQDRRSVAPLDPVGGPVEGIEKLTLSPSGLGILDEHVGTGRMPQAGEICEVQYTGWYWMDGVRGASFDSSYNESEPFSFTLGEGQVIKGWDEGIASMRVGGVRFLVIPPELAYGDKGVKSANPPIPPKAWLAFEVELLAIR